MDADPLDAEPRPGRPVVTPAEMAAIDADAPEPVEVLIERAGWAVARSARRLLAATAHARTSGARILVVAGKGNNGADGRSAARHLAAAGGAVDIIGPGDGVPPGRRYDLVIDAAFGTGFRGTYDGPAVGDVPVLAVDIPSGVDGSTGAAPGAPLPATATVTFAAPKPGLLFEPGRSLAGPVEVADIGLDCSRARIWLLDEVDVLRHWPRRRPTDHKWRRAVWVVGGGPGMDGAPGLAAAATARAGAGYVAVSIPGAERPGPSLPVESVYRPVAGAWAATVIDDGDRFASFVLGPGLPADDLTGIEVRSVVAATGDRGVVCDGGAIDAVAADPTVLDGRDVPAVLTPHDGEFARLVGRAPGPDRIDDVRRAAAELGAVIVAKGPTTVVAHPDGRVLVSAAGDARLATAGTGDVLAGIVGAGLAGGLDPFLAGGLAAELHARAACRGRDVGLIASDLPPLVADVLSGDPRRVDRASDDRGRR